MLAKRPQWGIILDTFTPVLAVLAALLIGALMLRRWM